MLLCSFKQNSLIYPYTLYILFPCVCVGLLCKNVDSLFGAWIIESHYYFQNTNIQHGPSCYNPARAEELVNTYRAILFSLVELEEHTNL